MLKSKKDPPQRTLFQYILFCAIGGFLACSITHALTTPIDFFKVYKQTKKSADDKKTSMGMGEFFSQIIEKHGIGGCFQGIGPTFIGYGLQGVFKFGLYELFKNLILKKDFITPLYQFAGFVCSSAAAEFVADIFLSPFEIIKLKMQPATILQDTHLLSISEAIAEIQKNVGFIKAVKINLVLLWPRQIIYTIIKFSTFEYIVLFLFYLLFIFFSIPRSKCSKISQMGVVFAAGLIAGVFCAVATHPIDTLMTRASNNQSNIEDPAIGMLAYIQDLYSGLMFRIIQVGILTGLQWLIYDTFKTSFQLEPPVKKD